jgi:hypothetical protein
MYLPVQNKYISSSTPTSTRTQYIPSTCYQVHIKYILSTYQEHTWTLYLICTCYVRGSVYESAFGAPIVHHECVQNIIAVQSARDPTRHQQVPSLQETGHTMEEGMNYHLRPANLSTFTHMDCMQESTNNFKTDQKYYARDSILRSTRVTTRIEVDANGVVNEPTTSGAPRSTIENATCPFMFPNGIGWCDGKFMSMLRYIQLRMCQLVSAFTLCHAYAMILFQIYQVSTLLNNLSEARIESALHQYYKQHPNSKSIDAMCDVTKRTVPSKLVGSPSYHRSALQDLLAMVHDYGLLVFLNPYI